MAKQNLSALNSYLFEQLKRLNDDSLSREELQSEIQRALTVSSVAKRIIDNASLALSVQIAYGSEVENNKPKLLSFDD